MARKKSSETTIQRPGGRQIHRCWVELRDRRDGSVRELPLVAFRRVHLTARKGELPLPDEQALRLEDGAEFIETTDFAELRARLREKYPDVHFERSLRSVRDLEAEQRKAEAMDALMQLVVEAVLEDLQREEAGAAVD